MTKQDDIKEGIINILAKRHCRHLYKPILTYLHSQGVVIKVDNVTDYVKCPCDDCTAENKLIDEYGYLCDLACHKRTHWICRLDGQEILVNAGYTAVEELIMT